MRPFEYLFMRRMKFDYISPPICEALFSSTGEPTIILETFERDKVMGLELDNTGGVHLKWSAFPGALCYSVYQADTDAGPWVLVAECVEEFEIPDPTICYAVTAITPDGESDISNHICPSVVECPVWVSEIAGYPTVACGSDIVLSCEAVVVSDPTIPITYRWKLDGVDIFSETNAGASAYFKAGVAAADSGTYTVKAVYLACSIDSTFDVDVAGCGGGGGGCNCTGGSMPADFMEAENPEVTAQTITATPDAGDNSVSPAPDGDQPYSLTPGEYRLEYISGSMLFCRHNDQNNCGSSTFESICSVFHNVWAETRVPGPFQNPASFLYGGVADEIGGVEPAKCVQGGGLKATIEAGAASEPKPIFILEPIIGQPLNLAFSGTWSGGVWPANNFHTCGGQNGDADATNNTKFKLVRQRKFISQPVRYIDAWNTVRTLITPADAIAQVWPAGDNWASGDFDEEAIRRHYNQWGFFSPSVKYQFNDEYIPANWLREPTIGGGWVNCRRSVITTALGPSGFWQLSIWGEYTTSDPFYPNQANILWRGRKYHGDTAAGAYCWTVSFDPLLETTLPCVVLL